MIRETATGDDTCTHETTSTSALTTVADTSVCYNDSPTRAIEMDGQSTGVRHLPGDREDTPAPTAARPRKQRPDAITNTDEQKPAAKKSLGLENTANTKLQYGASAANTGLVSVFLT